MADVTEQIQAFGLELAAYAKSGPTSPAHAAGIRQRIDKFITANAVSPETAVQTYRQSSEAFLARVVEARGLPVTSVASTGVESAENDLGAVDPAVSERFDEFLPSLRNLLEECVAVHAEQAGVFLAQQRSTFERLLSDFIDEIPEGGTKAAVVRSHVNPIKNALAELLQWAADLDRLQATSFASEVRDFLTPAANNAIAMVWRYSPWSCLVSSHRDLDERLYAVRGNWALQKGLMLVPSGGFSDEVKSRRRELGCMCTFQFVFNVTGLPTDTLTPAGIAMVASAASRREEFMRSMKEPPQVAPSPTSTPVPAQAPTLGFFGRFFGRKTDG